MPEKTTKARRIDFVWANKQAELVVRDYWTQKNYATHETLRVELSVMAFSQTKTERAKPMSWMGRAPRLELEEEQEEAIVDKVELIREEEWTSAMDKLKGGEGDKEENRKEVDRLVDIWS